MPLNWAIVGAVMAASSAYDKYRNAARGRRQSGFMQGVGYAGAAVSLGSGIAAGVGNAAANAGAQTAATTATGTMAASGPAMQAAHTGLLATQAAQTAGAGTYASLAAAASPSMQAMHTGMQATQAAQTAAPAAAGIGGGVGAATGPTGQTVSTATPGAAYGSDAGGFAEQGGWNRVNMARNQPPPKQTAFQRMRQGASTKVKLDEDALTQVSDMAINRQAKKAAQKQQDMAEANAAAAGSQKPRKMPQPDRYRFSPSWERIGSNAEAIGKSRWPDWWS